MSLFRKAYNFVIHGSDNGAIYIYSPMVEFVLVMTRIFIVLGAVIFGYMGIMFAFGIIYGLIALPLGLLGIGKYLHPILSPIYFVLTCFVMYKGYRFLKYRN